VTSAVSLLTAKGDVDTEIPSIEEGDGASKSSLKGNLGIVTTRKEMRDRTGEGTDLLSLWQIYLSDVGRAESNSASNGPVTCVTFEGYHQEAEVFIVVVASRSLRG